MDPLVDLVVKRWGIVRPLAEDLVAIYRFVVKNGGSMMVTSGRRGTYKPLPQFGNTESQKKIYDEWRAGLRPGPVAKPGTSDHERGRAADVEMDRRAAGYARGRKGLKVLDEGHVYHLSRS